MGPIARLATGEEIDAYLALADDAAAAAFIERFWASRDPAPDRPGNPLREAFDQRAAEADKQFTEGGYRGRRTARGTIYVLFGPPAEVDHDISPDPQGPPIEIWRYKGGATAGLDGERPARVYRFIRRGDLTVFYVPTDSRATAPAPERGPPRGSTPRHRPRPRATSLEAVPLSVPAPAAARAVLAGTGISIPPRVVDNHTLARVMDTSDEWIRERSGVVERRYVEPGVGTADLGAEAARAALADAGVDGGRDRLPGRRHHDAGPLLPRLRHADPAAAGHPSRCRPSTSASSAPASPTACRWSTP